MAHFLSEVTHQRLELRDIPDGAFDPDKVYSTGVVKTHVFRSAMRCISVIGNCTSDDMHSLGRYAEVKDITAFASTMKKSLGQTVDVTEGADGVPVDSMPRLQVWSGDTEGSVTARLGLTGAPQYILAQRREKVYAYSMHYHDPHVWVGFTDGFLHIFEAASGARVCEMRAHTAAINCIVTVGNYIFTGGSDWQILQWDPVMLKRVPHGQLSGHQNAVRCLAGATMDSPAGGVLYSGGDDYVVRCWDLDTGYERSDPWPIVGHDEAVRSIAVHGIYLFSASTDGTVRAWNTQTAQLVRILDDRGRGVGAVTLAIDAASPALWAGGTDGIIRMWNAQSLALIGERKDHHATQVAKLQSVARANAVKAWVLDNEGNLTTMFSDPDGACAATGTGGYDALKPLELELAQQIDSRRSTILQNYDDLLKCRDEFEGLRTAERNNKTKFAEASGRHQARALTITASDRCSRFVIKRRHSLQQRRISAMMAAAHDQTLRRRYAATWLVFTYGKTDAKQKKRVVAWAREARNEALAERYAFLLTENDRVTRGRATALLAARNLAAATALPVQRKYWALWRARRHARVLEAQKLPFIRSQQKLNAAALLRAYWAKVRHAVVTERSQRARANATKLLSNATPLCLLTTYYTKWRGLKAQKNDDKLRRAAASVMYVAAEREMGTMYFVRWLSTVSIKSRKATEFRLNEETAELQEMKRLVENSAGVNEKTVEEALAEKQRILATLRIEEQVWDARLKRGQQVKRQLERDALTSPEIDSTEPLEQQLEQAMFLLKTRGVNVKANEDDILDAKESVAQSNAATVFAEGLTMVRKTLSAAVKPRALVDKEHPCWLVGDLFSKITEKKVLKASKGIARMATAYDLAQTKNGTKQWLTFNADGLQVWTEPQFDEAITNFGTLMELSLRAFRLRRKEDMVTGEPKEAKPKRARSKSKSRASSKEPKRAKSGTKKIAAKKKKRKSITEGAEASPATDGGETEGAAAQETEGEREASPEAASPEAASPEAASPEAASPEAASPEAASPDAASPEKDAAEDVA